MLLSLSEKAVDNTLALLDLGATIPFISRYRKERTGGLDEVQIGDISNLNDSMKEMSARKETIIKVIGEAGKLTDELKNRIERCWNAAELEDIYLPYTPKRRTRAQIAREKGLEPLAEIIKKQYERNLASAAAKYVGKDVESVEDAIAGARDIIAEEISENEGTRNLVRKNYARRAMITSKVVKSKKDTDEAAKYSDYFDFTEPLRRCSSHRLLAMRRGENEGILRVSITSDDDENIANSTRYYVHGRGECQSVMADAVEDSYKRLIQPSIENEFASSSKEAADKEAIKVFVDNLEQLLLAAPLGQKRVLAIDPGFRTGCKIVCLDEQGNLVNDDVIYPHPPKNLAMMAGYMVKELVEQYDIQAIAIGNGTASRETSRFIKDLKLPDEIGVYVVSEDGASVYSASETAREEFPDKDVTVRGAVSIGRRLMDPLAELVKIDPKSIGVGQYQHDVDQSELKKSLDRTVEMCVNRVGVNLNTASRHLLTYVSGLGPTLASNIVDYRTENGAFKSRKQLLDVPRLGPATFEQCAGFLRIPHAENPLDNSAVHPESYGVVNKMAADCGCTVPELMKNAEMRKKIRLEDYVTDKCGMPPLTDIMSELEKPGRDPRSQIEEFEFDSSVHDIEDLEEGMILPGIVTNITKFGVFVDVGVHQDGLVHISQLANHFVKDPGDVVKLHQHVTVKVIEVDRRRHRIALTMKGLK